MQALELCFSSKTPTTPTTAAAAATKAPATAAAASRAVEVAPTEPADVKDEDAEQLATVGRPEFYSALRPDTEEQHDEDGDDVASDVSGDDDAVHSDSEQEDSNNDNDDRYTDEEFDTELVGDVSTGDAPDSAEIEPLLATVSQDSSLLQAQAEEDALSGSAQYSRIAVDITAAPQQSQQQSDAPASPPHRRAPSNEEGAPAITATHSDGIVDGLAMECLCIDFGREHVSDRHNSTTESMSI
jgi:hypothetical protein